MAIAFDAAGTGGIVNPGTSLTFSHTCTGTLLRLYVVVFGDLKSGDATGNKITGVTYNAVSMTEVDRMCENNGGTPGSNRWAYLFRLDGPATGAHNVVVSASGSIVIGGGSASYTGVKQTGANDNKVTNFATASTSLTCTLTPVAANCWTVAGLKNGGGAQTAGAGTTNRVASANGYGIVDSNAAKTAGVATSLVATQGSTAWAGIMTSFEPDTGGGSTDFGGLLGGRLVNRGLLKGRLVA